MSGVVGGGVMSTFSRANLRIIVVKQKVKFRVGQKRGIPIRGIRGVFHVGDRDVTKRLGRLLTGVPLRRIRVSGRVVSCTGGAVGLGLGRDVCIALASRVDFTVDHYGGKVRLRGTLL